MKFKGRHPRTLPRGRERRPTKRMPLLPPPEQTASAKVEPFCWCSKMMLRRIREKAEEPASTVAVYVALCEISSDCSDAPEFTATHQHIASKASVSRRTVVSRLHDLEQLGAISMTIPKLKAPATYRLLSSGPGYLTIGNGCRTLRNGCTALCNESSASVAHSRRNREETEERPSPSRPSSTFARMQTAERIALENRLKALREKEKRLAGELSDRVQRETRPEDVAKLKRYRAEIQNIERQLGYELD